MFASGGLHNVWEKSIAPVYRLLFENKLLKIIRASWIDKHLGVDLAKEFEGHENKLHSEFYYSLFFRHFFGRQLKELQNHGKLKSLSVRAFSWWDVCDSCESRLTEHNQDPQLAGVNVSYEIFATRRYNHEYPDGSIISSLRNHPRYEDAAWARIRSKIAHYAQYLSGTPAQRRQFWTATRDGLELCRWLGQAFEENIRGPNDLRRKPGKRGDVLSFYSQMSDVERGNLRRLLNYLSKHNWELSCWYKQQRPHAVTGKWRNNWQQLVMPHFGWELMDELDYTSGMTAECELCGKSEIHNIKLIFHPKFRVSAKFLAAQADAEENMTEDDSNLGGDDAWDLPAHKLRQSLVVGSNCVQVALYTRKDIEEWRATHPSKENEKNWSTNNFWAAQNAQIEALSKAERESKLPSKKRKRKS